LPDGSPDGLLVGSLVPSVRRQRAQRISCRLARWIACRPLGSLSDGSSDGSSIGSLALPLVGGLPDGLLVGPLIGLLDGLPDGLSDGWPVTSLAASPNGFS